MKPHSTTLRLKTDLGTIYVIEVAGIGPFNEVKQHSMLIDAFERRFLTLTLPSLIQSKRSTGRDKNRDALPELESLLETESE